MSPTTKQDFLHGQRIWISTSSTADIVESNRVQILVLELCRYIFAANGTVAYGGDLRRNGVTLSFYEAAFRHFPDQETRRTALLHALPEAGYAKIAAASLRELRDKISPIGSLVLIDQNGQEIATPVAGRHAISKEASQKSLSHMRTLLAEQCDAMVAFAGRAATRNRASGVAKEVALFYATGKPLYVLGGFGGACADPTLDGLVRNYNDGLSKVQRQVLQSSAHMPEVMGLILKGLRRRLG